MPGKFLLESDEIEAMMQDAEKENAVRQQAD